MSFFKELFEKRKDAKYGKGHKLGTSQENSNTEENTNQNNKSPATQNVFQRPSTSQNLTQNEASKKAAEAALARQKSKNSSSTKKCDLSKEASQKIEQLNLERQNKNTELDKALKLKEHYFGQEKKIVDDTSLYSKNKIYFKSVGILREDERYEKNEIEDRIEMALLNRLDENGSPDDEIILVVVTLFMTANYKSEEKLKKCLELINRFVENILKAPGEEKFRKIRIENPTVKEKLMSCKYIDMVLTNSGFTKRTQLNSDTNLLEDYFVYDGNDMESLNRLKTVLDIAEPIIPDLDRDIKIFQASSSSNLPEIDLSDEFYNATLEEIKLQQKLRNEALETQGVLRTKQMRERDEKMELRLYNYCLIRIRFPDDYILQAVFKSKEKMKVLYELIQDFLQVKSSFEFFGHSMKKSSINNNTNDDNYMNMTLAEAGLAPSALINFRYTDVNEQSHFSLNKKLYINPDLIQKHLFVL